MDALNAKYQDISQLDGFRFEYWLENGTVLSFTIRKRNIPHLLGLHKLVDIPVLGRFANPSDLVVNANYVISKIRQERLLTDSAIRSSAYFPLVRDRYDSLSKETLLSLSFTDVVIDFNPSLAGSSLRSDYLLFEKLDTGYRHLGLVIDHSNVYVPESYFYEPTDLYIRGQISVKVNRLRFYDRDGNIILEEAFI